LGISSKKQKSFDEIKTHLKNLQTCPICKEKFEISLESDLVKCLEKQERFPYPHIHLHGTPLHAMVCYIDKESLVRAISGIHSIQIFKDSSTRKEILKK
jgi:hypothetical protein